MPPELSDAGRLAAVRGDRAARHAAGADLRRPGRTGHLHHPRADGVHHPGRRAALVLEERHRQGRPAARTGGRAPPRRGFCHLVVQERRPAHRHRRPQRRAGQRHRLGDLDGHRRLGRLSDPLARRPRAGRAVRRRRRPARVEHRPGQRPGHPLPLGHRRDRPPRRPDPDDPSGRDLGRARAHPPGQPAAAGPARPARRRRRRRLHPGRYGHRPRRLLRSVPDRPVPVVRDRGRRVRPRPGGRQAHRAGPLHRRAPTPTTTSPPARSSTSSTARCWPSAPPPCSSSPPPA